MSKDDTLKSVSSKRIVGNGGYQPLSEGYQPSEKRPASGSANNLPPKPPKGGTGQSSGKK